MFAKNIKYNQLIVRTTTTVTAGAAAAATNPLSSLCLSTAAATAANIDRSLPVIKVPKYLQSCLNDVRHREDKRTKQWRKTSQQPTSAATTTAAAATTNQKPSASDRRVCVISSSTDKSFNHHLNQQYRQNSVPLISKLWMNGNKTNGQRMRFHAYEQNPSPIVKQLSDELVTFGSLGLSETVCEAIESMAITEPTAIQRATIPLVLTHRNVVCSAETASGKTLAYLAPVIQMIRATKEQTGDDSNQRTPRGLVVVPSRELAQQVGQVAQQMGAYCGVGVAVMMGGQPKHMTHSGMDLIISTIGLVRPMFERNIYSFKWLNHLVIDESDTLFDDTFGSDILDILANVMVRDNDNKTDSDNEEHYSSDGPPEPPIGTQLMCVSATLPTNLPQTLGKMVDIDANIDRISTQRLHHIMPHVRQDFYRLHKYDRDLKLIELVKKDVRDGRPLMIFTNRSDASNWVYHYLNENGVQCLRLNAELSDDERIDQFERFQRGDCNVISCTDLASRGLDTVRVRHVINFDCPRYVSDYIHRSGRTGRLGVNGQCLVSTFVSFKPDIYMLQKLEYALRVNSPIESVDANIKQQLTNKLSVRKYQ